MATKEYQKRYPEKYKNYILQRTFGITIGEYKALLELQSNACAICKKANRTDSHNGLRKKQLGVDHDHKTGSVRGLLCNDCNRAIGLLRDSAELLRKAANYLDFHTERYRKLAETADRLLEDLLL